MSFKPGDRLTHRENPELGAGLVRQVEGRFLVVEFPRSGTTLRLAAGSTALRPFEIRAGARARLEPSGESVVVAAAEAEAEAAGRVRLEDGREVAPEWLWPEPPSDELLERLVRGEVDDLDAFALRLDALDLARLREADRLGSFLGGRIRLFPHQLHVAERATRSDPVRWLLADEVGLGKTVEACLILNHLVRTGRAARVLVVAPATLTVQWLGELWRKYHQVFVHIDPARLNDVERDFGRGFSPFDAHPQAVVALELLREDGRLRAQAAQATLDLLVVDEAHHLRRPPGHPGDPAYRAVAPLVASARHALLLTATPLEDDAHGFFRLLQLLRPDELPESTAWEERLERGQPLPPCTSATRRVDIGGLPPRQGRPIDLPAGAGTEARERLIAALREAPAAHAVARARLSRRIQHALASGAALVPLLERAEGDLRELAAEADRDDPRLRWLAGAAPGWKRRGEKTLIFTAHRETLEWVRAELGRLTQLRSGIFHEELQSGARDIEVAQFRSPAGPSLLLSTECGGEGRNFEFCTRLLLWDLPWSPTVVEQRIGRLDRIGRRLPVEIVYFRPPSGLGREVAELYESLGIFARPLSGLERELSAVENGLNELALDRLAPLVADTQQAWTRVQRAAFHELHRDPYRPELAAELLARVPGELDERVREVVLAAAEQLDLHVEPQRSEARYAIEFGRRARVDSLPGVPGTSSFLGTFDREEAVADESIDFFASGHPLVEGLLAWLEDSPLGRVALLQARLAGSGGIGLLALYRGEAGFDAVAVDPTGQARPEWAERFTARPLRTRRVDAASLVSQPGWAELVRGLGAGLPADRGRPIALAILVVSGTD